MDTATLIDRLNAARRTATPLVRISTPDPAALMKSVLAAFDREDSKTPIPMVSWDSMEGLKGLNKAGAQAIAAVLENDNAAEWPAMTTNPGAAVLMMASLPGEQREGNNPKGALIQRGTICFMLNAQRFVEDRNVGNPAQVIQGVWNLRDAYKRNRRTLVMVTTVGSKLPPELSSDVITFDEPFPSDEQLRKIITTQVEAVGLTVKPEVVESAVDALRSLSAFTAEQLVAMALTKDGIDIDELWEQKIMVIESTDGLSVDRGEETFDDVRGLANFKKFAMGFIKGKRGATLYVRIDEGEKSFGGLGQNGGAADNTGTTQDRLGVMLKKMEDNKWTGLIAVGHAGCGKTLISKAMANTASKVTGRRVLSLALDLGATSTSELGGSEKKIRQVMKVLEGLAAGGRVCFLMTCNQLDILPPALKRRFKLGTWMFDLPTKEERAPQWEMYMKQYGIKKQTMPDDTDWTGSDIRNVCDVADQLECSLIEACDYTTFVAKSDPDAVVKLRRLADGKFVNASAPGTYKAPFTDKQFTAPAPTGRAARAGRDEEV